MYTLLHFYLISSCYSVSCQFNSRPARRKNLERKREMSSSPTEAYYRLGFPWASDLACAKLLQLYLILCDSEDHSLPGSFVHGILQARILECVAVE